MAHFLSHSSRDITVNSVTRVCSGDGVTGDGGDGNVTSDRIFTGEVTGEGMVTGEAFLTGEIYLDTLQI